MPNPLPMALPPLVLALLVGACAGAPPEPQPPDDCGDIVAGITRAEHARAQAEQQRAHAWMNVVPFAVAARYASAQSAVEAAERRLRDLHDRADRGGCLVATR